MTGSHRLANNMNGVSVDQLTESNTSNRSLRYKTCMVISHLLVLNLFLIPGHLQYQELHEP